MYKKINVVTGIILHFVITRNQIQKKEKILINNRILFPSCRSRSRSRSRSLSS